MKKVAVAVAESTQKFVELFQTALLELGFAERLPERHLGQLGLAFLHF